ncbi:tethering factor for nuclear proteasome sts1 [Xylona heveae TC161]|uniref:Tethering factor for nuclear proteasome STS1 n=1 Tax=Xylona heveae (strain CBS 132557 / TC161) TaxID=1328760 RepID=A0A165J552_XYLHT|nr:tethering factor for nuclear proteasome sts1 [Xylona heveae TC161]KZF25742.1 tethering factor for nuclear proteasome sts1 [Xylona heveae TC161]
MNSLLSSYSVFPPHLHENQHTRPSPLRSMTTPPSHMHAGMAGRKRKADDEDIESDRYGSHDSISSTDNDERMSASPANSPAIVSRHLAHAHSHNQSHQQQRHIKRSRPNVSGRPLSLNRLLETLNADEMRTVLRSICERHPVIGSEVVSTAPRPSVSSALNVLKQYEESLFAAFPFGGNSRSDYTYNRIRGALMELLDALNDFSPHFLPPNENQVSTSLSFLDGATDMIHRLPTFESFQNNLPKSTAYEEIAKAWALVIREAAKRGGGIQLQYGGWDQKLAKHNEESQGKLQDAVNELTASLGWMGGNAIPSPGSQMTGLGDMSSIRAQLLSGTYGANLPVRVGPW